MNGMSIIDFLSQLKSPKRKLTLETCLSIISKIIDTIYWALLCAGDHAEYFLQSISFNLDLFLKQAYIVICSQSRFPAPSWYHHTYR